MMQNNCGLLCIHASTPKESNRGEFIHSDHFYSASSSPLLLRSAPDTAQILCQSFTLKRHRQLRVKNLPKVLIWLLEQDSSQRPFGQKALNLPMSHHVPLYVWLPVRQRILYRVSTIA